MKIKIIRDRLYLNWLREQPCAVSGKYPPSDPCHTFKSLGGGGIGLKSSDKTAVPLSQSEHRKQSGMGEVDYWRTVIIDRPLLQSKMVRCFLYSGEISYPTSFEFWKDLLSRDDVMVKKVVHAFAEVEYYNQFLKGPMP